MGSELTDRVTKGVGWSLVLCVLNSTVKPAEGATACYLKSSAVLRISWMRMTGLDLWSLIGQYVTGRSNFVTGTRTSKECGDYIEA